MATLLQLSLVAAALSSVTTGFRRSKPTGLTKVEADFVIVGAGTAGSLLAERLSKVGSVIILECGSELPESVRSRLPGAGCTYDQIKSEIISHPTFWQDWSTRNNCLAGMRRSIGSKVDPSGLDIRMGPGGTSVVAVGIHFRGGVKYWKEIAKDHGGHWLLPEATLSKLEQEMSVRESPIAVDQDHVLFSQAFSKGASGEQSGVFPRYQDESGWSTNAYSQFLKKAVDYENVRMLTNACAHRLIKGDDQSAPVVELEHHDNSTWKKTSLVHAKREVIVAAGALGSPALLQRSGLTTASAREQAVIRMAWPCGKCKYRNDFLNGLQTFFQEHADASKPPAPLTLPVYDSGTFIDLGDAPAMIVASTGIGTAQSNGLPSVANRRAGESLLVVHIVLLQPRSFEGTVDDQGRLHVSRALTDPKDLDAAVHGIQLVRKVVEEQASSSLGQLDLGGEVFPGLHRTTDSDLRKALQLPSEDIVHLFQSATASCRLGQVVDGEMNVIGMPNVRVADASVLPKPPLGRTLFSTLTVAEVASRLIAAQA